MTTELHSSQRVLFTEGSTALPPGFEDRTANIFVPADPQTQPNLSIARDTLLPDEALSAYVDRQLGVLKAKMPGHKLLARQAQLLGAELLEGERIDSSYKNGAQTIWQRQAAFVVSSSKVLIFSAATARGFTDSFEALWQQWLQSYQGPTEHV